MKNIKYLLELLKIETEKYKEFLQEPLQEEELQFLKYKFEKTMYNKLDEYYLNILSITNGIDNDGVVLYASETKEIKGYNDRFIEGIIEANNIWHEDIYKKNLIFYAESELYLFYQNTFNNVFYCVYRDDFSNIVFETKNANIFFQKIISLSLGNDIEN